ncbi:MAG: hypothetical protein WBY53_04315, partial [Acidobacteriaceae bacterium]
LTQSPLQFLTYRIEFFNSNHHTAGFSNSTTTASGPPPPPVDGLKAEGTRLGILLSWNSIDREGAVVLHREDLSPVHSKSSKAVNAPFHTATPAAIWLGTQEAEGTPTNRILDTNVLPDTLYRYTAQRRLKLQVDSREIELRSQLSAPITVTLRRIYPPPAPTELTAVGFASGEPPAFAVDLVWQPANARGLVTPLAGYNIYREPVDADGKETAPQIQLNRSPTPSPAFHDTTANPHIRYRYSVSAVDAQGNASGLVTTILEPSAVN